MPHFFIPPGNIKKNKFIINGQESHHLIRVRRVKVGDELNLFDGTGKSYTVKIEKITKEEIEGVILKEKFIETSGVNVNLFQAVPKGDRFDWLIEKVAELGVKSITPLITSRSVVKDISESKISRWQRVSKSASSQSARPDIMEIMQPAKFQKVIENLNEDSLNIIPWEGEEAKNISEVFKSGKKTKEINMIVGPEGGFTIEEIKNAEHNKIIPVTLGKRILRSETAGLLTSILVLDKIGEYSKK